MDSSIDCKKTASSARSRESSSSSSSDESKRKYKSTNTSVKNKPNSRSSDASSSDSVTDQILRLSVLDGISAYETAEETRMFDVLTTDFPLSKIVCVDELEELAKIKLKKSVFDYFGAGSDEEITLQWNRSALANNYCLKPRVMRDVSHVDLTRYIFGDKLSMPIGVSPTALQKMVHPSGEIGTVKACDRINALMVLSLFSTTSLEDVARQAPVCTKWQNIYILKDRELTQSVVNRAIRYNYRALVVTCDAPILGTRRRDIRNNFSLGEHQLENIKDSSRQSLKEHSSEIFDPSVTWQDLADLKKSVGDTIRVIAKGILTPEDAEEAIKAGVDGIYVSNHGGRQLDGASSTIEALPAIVDVVNKRCPVFVDGGFRTGADILKALALGADMVLVGRPTIWGLASYGEEGAYAALRMLRDELEKAMMLCGCTKLSDINRGLVLDRSERLFKL